MNRKQSRYFVLYAMFLPCFVFFVVFSYIPMAWILLAFKNFRFDRSLLGFEWVGLKNFIKFFSYYRSAELVRNTFVIGFIKVLFAFPFPILFAIMLNEIKTLRIRKAFQTISYLPHFVSWVVVATIIQRLLAPDIGILNSIHRLLGGSGDTFYLMEAKYFYAIVTLSHIWKSIGWGSIIYLAAISNIDPQLYDAAGIDGANKLQQIWYITLPALKATAGVLFILGLGDILTSGFEQIYLLRTPGTLRVADTLDVFVIEQGLKQAKFAYATAVGLLQGLVGLIFIIVSNAFAKKFMETSLW